MKTHPTDENWYKYDPIFQLYRSTRPLLGHSTCPSARTTSRQLSKPKFHLWTTITIRVEMAPLMTEPRSDYQHTSILTHSNSTTTTIWQHTPDFVLQQPQKIVIVNFTGWVCSPIPPCLWKFLPNQKESGKLWAKEKLERGRRRFGLFGYCS